MQNWRMQALPSGPKFHAEGDDVDRQSIAEFVYDTTAGKAGTSAVCYVQTLAPASQLLSLGRKSYYLQDHMRHKLGPYAAPY